MTAFRAAGLLLLGLLVGVLASVEHRQHGAVGDVPLPWGLVLALASTWIVAFVAGSLTRRGAVWFALGWVVHLLLVTTGDGYLVADDPVGWTYTVLAATGLLVVLARVQPARRPGADPRAGSRPPT